MLLAGSNCKWNLSLRRFLCNLREDFLVNISHLSEVLEDIIDDDVLDTTVSVLYGYKVSSFAYGVCFVITRYWDIFFPVNCEIDLNRFRSALNNKEGKILHHSKKECVKFSWEEKDNFVYVFTYKIRIETSTYLNKSTKISY